MGTRGQKELGSTARDMEEKSGKRALRELLLEYSSVIVFFKFKHGIEKYSTFMVVTQV